MPTRTRTTQQRTRQTILPAKWPNRSRAETARTKADSLKNVRRILKAAINHPGMETGKARELAYKLALPQLGSRAEIKEFIQHVAQGIALGVFNGREGSQLLYAAQISMSALTAEKGGKANAGALHKADRGSKRLVQPMRKGDNAPRR